MPFGSGTGFAGYAIGQSTRSVMDADLCTTMMSARARRPMSVTAATPAQMVEVSGRGVTGIATGDEVGR